MKLETDRIWRPRWRGFLALAFALASAFAAVAQPLVLLLADRLPPGPLATWPNNGSLGGAFINDGTHPKVEVIQGVTAVTFSGADRMLAPFTAPESITGSKPWTCVVRAFNPGIAGEETMVSWSSRPNNCLQIEYGNAPAYGAIGTWADPHTLGWTKGVPAAGAWHTLIYQYTGGKDGTLRAWCDGELRAEKIATLNTKSGKPLLLGACLLEGTPENRQTLPFSGSLAMVQIHDRALTPLEIWNASGKRAALPFSPGRGAMLSELATQLTWLRGTDEAESFDVYLGNNRAGVESADNSMPAGAAADAGRIYKGNQPSGRTIFRLDALELGQKYFWRVDQRDRNGKVAWRGEVWEFATESGQAARPSPPDQWPLVEGSKPSLGWRPGKFATAQNFFFGDTLEKVRDAKTPDAANLPVTATNAPMPARALETGKTCYWRVDQINGDKLPVSKGEVWSFRVVKKKLKVYLLGGQSNMSGCASVKGVPPELIGPQKDVIIFARGSIKVKEYGWDYLRDGLGDGYGDRDGAGSFGPELTFGRDMAAGHPGEVIALIKCAWGATDLGVQWRPPGAGGKTGPLYTSFVKAVRDGLGKLDPAFEPEMAGMIWMQGEADALYKNLYPQYETNLTCFINDIRAEFKQPRLPFVIGQIATAKAYAPPMWGAEVRQAQVNVSKSLPQTALFETGDYKLVDPWHYDTAGMISLGSRFAKAMLALERGTPGGAK